jgi:dienelactone hydrolase
VQYPELEESLARILFRPVEPYPSRDLSSLVPFSDEEFQTLKAHYEYDRTPLNDVIEGTDDNSPFWRKEKITFDAAYGGERVIAYLFLPKAVKPPYQTVIYFPGRAAVFKESFTDLHLPQRNFTEFVIRGGRALLYPVYKGTYERPAALMWTIDSIARTPLAYRDLTIQMAKDLSRSIDYLETRDDIDSERLAYYGFCWGALLGPYMLAVEDRLDTGIFAVGGIPPVEVPRSFDPALFAQRVKAPILMVTGKEDHSYPLTTSQIPMFGLLGTPNEDKEHKLYPGGHGLYVLFGKQIQGDVLGWLDRYLGPVESR